MDRFVRAVPAVFIVCAVTAVSFLFDGWAGRVPQYPALNILARVGSGLGNGLFLAAVSIVLYVIGIKSAKDQFKDAGKSGIFAVVLSGVAVNILKTAFERPRPGHATGAVLRLLEHPSLFDFSSVFNSMPSGHATAAFAFAWVSARRAPRLAPVFYGLALCVAASRVYLGAHYPSDVVIGALVGTGAGWLITNKVNIKERWLIGGLVALTIFVSFFKPGGFLLFDVDEAVFSEATREMVETGDYITPTYNYVPRYDKPILFYWLASGAFRLGGASEASARAVSGIGGVLLVLMTFAFVRRIKGGTAAFFAALALLLNIEFFVYSHSAVVDMTLALFIAASIYAFYLGVHEDDHRWFAAFWAASALAVLTKGVIGALFPVAIAVIHLAVSKDLTRVKKLFRPSYILLFFLMATPWFAAEYSVHGREFFDAFIIKHHIQRYSDVISSHSGPVYFYIGVLIIGFFPWVALLPGGIVSGIKERITPDNGLYLLSSTWFLFVLVFFSMAKTKLPNYIFPLFAPAAIIAGGQAASIVERKDALARAGVYVLIGLSIILGTAITVLPFLNVRMDITLSASVFYGIGAVFFATGAAGLWGLWGLRAMRGPLSAFIGISGLALCLIVALRLYALPPLNAAFQKDLYVLSSYAGRCGKDAKLAAYGINKPSIAFYAARRAARIEKSSQSEIAEAVGRGPFLLITETARIGELSGHKALRPIMSRGRYTLLGNAECGGPENDGLDF
ncbi:MAG: phosphatase PAP2 family protein [Deltaproteobacteria bacterium]|nr:phosphatase PAP2 family protein [Deltaproteobacteria bacterium]